MGGGAPLEYLNKKTWHPGRTQNKERVWLAEQAAAAEQRKLEELRAERDEERAREELEALAQGSGARKKREEKLDWMYQGGVAASKKVEEEQAQREKDEEARREREEREKSERERGNQRWLVQGDNTNTSNEIWQRLHGDPLMMMKQQEMQARRNIVSNPVKMDAVRRRVEDEKRRKEEKRRSKREHKEKKERRESGGKERREGEERREHKHKRSRHEDREYRRDDREHRRDDRGHRRDDRERRRDDRAHQQDINGHRLLDDDRRNKAMGTVQDGMYGLSHSAAAPEHVKTRVNTLAIEETKKRLDEAAQRHEEEARREEEMRSNHRSHHERKKYKSKTLSEEERRRRLEEMTNNSSQFDAARRSRVNQHTQTAEAEEKALLDRGK